MSDEASDQEFGDIDEDDLFDVTDFEGAGNLTRSPTVFLTWLPDVLRAAGLTVQTEPGWETRARGSGSGFRKDPIGVTWHHTASNQTLEQAVQLMCHTQGARPIANIAVGRDGTVVVMAAGPTNTSGKSGKANIKVKMSRGTIPVGGANGTTVGMECLNNGTGQSWPAAQVDAAFACVLAINERLGNAPDDVVTHNYYTLNSDNPAGQARKIDPAKASAVQGPWQPKGLPNGADTWDNDDLRAECRRRAGTASVAAAASTATGGTYTVQKSDGWFAVARGCGCSLEEVLAANNATVETPIFEGEVKQCPS
ncbi:MAG: N-acetylmuramoyl-L-alanine amidase [Ilumatobacteraceae bacterium]